MLWYKSSAFCSEASNGAEVVAELLEDVAWDKRREPKLQRQNSLALQRSSMSRGSNRLRDAVVYGYVMLRHARQEHVWPEPHIP